MSKTGESYNLPNYSRSVEIKGHGSPELDKAFYANQRCRVPVSHFLKSDDFPNFPKLQRVLVEIEPEGGFRRYLPAKYATGRATFGGVEYLLETFQWHGTDECEFYIRSRTETLR